VTPIDLHPEPHQAPLCIPTSCLDLEAAIQRRRDAPQGNVCGAAAELCGITGGRNVRPGRFCDLAEGAVERRNTDVRRQREEEYTAGCH